jgi:hypothetical protein
MKNRGVESLNLTHKFEQFPIVWRVYNLDGAQFRLF